MKKLIVLITIVAMIMGSTICANADSQIMNAIDNNTPSAKVMAKRSELAKESRGILAKTESGEMSLSKADEQLEDLSVDELNKLISVIASEDMANQSSYSVRSANETKEKSTSVSTKAIKLAWLAAASIARKCGYPCSATMVEHSVNGKNYYESGRGKLFSSRIMVLPSYRKCYRKMKDKNLKNLSFEITKSEHKDLYYALHLVNTKRYKKNGKWWMRVSDRFDFDIMHYKSLFTSIVNNWAWLCQHTGILSPIRATVEFQP